MHVQLRRYVQFVGNVFPVLFPLTDTFTQKVLDLSVHGAEIVLRPSGDRGVELGGKTKGDLFFALICHAQYRLPELTTGCAS